MKVDMVPRDGGLQIGLVELMVIIAIISIISAIAIPSMIAHNNTLREMEGKHVIVTGFDEMGLVTGVDGDRLLVYFPKTGEVKFKREMLRVVEQDK